MFCFICGCVVSKITLGAREMANTTKRTGNVALVSLLILLLCIIVQVGASHAQLGGNSGADQTFSIMQITDTQFLSMNYPTLFDNLTEWITANNSSYNVKMVVHTGDIVHHGDDPEQWANANASMSRFLDAGIPYSWDAGNHDQSSPDGIYASHPNGGWLGSQYLAFNATYMRKQPYWVSDLNDGKDTATKFNSGNYSFLLINLEFHANQSTIDDAPD
jgi:hypothetical protein